MAADKGELREILESNIGEVYKAALERAGDQAAAKDITRRVMTLLKRTYETGLSVTPETVKRLTEDCCKEQAYYDSKKDVFRHGVIADMPDFDTALSEITDEEVRSKARSDAENKAIEAHRAMRGAEALGAKVVSAEKAPKSAAEEFAQCFDMEAGAWEKEDGFARALKGWEHIARYEEDEYDDDDDDYDDCDDCDDYDDDDDDDDDDDEFESLFESKPRQPALPIIGAWVLIILLSVVAFCLVVMLMRRNVLPGGNSPLIQRFIAWFNSRLFPLF